VCELTASLSRRAGSATSLLPLNGAVLLDGITDVRHGALGSYRDAEPSGEVFDSLTGGPCLKSAAADACG